MRLADEVVVLGAPVHGASKLPASKLVAGSPIRIALDEVLLEKDHTVMQMEAEAQRVKELLADTVSRGAKWS